MFRITVITIGKTKESYWLEAIKEYKKRINKYSKLDWIELPETKQYNDIEKLKKAEFHLFDKFFSTQAFHILLDEKGKTYTSIEFSDFFKNLSSKGITSINFYIGGAYGFCEDIYKKNIHKISLSNMTFSHQMIRVIFIEQLYRAFTILNDEKYHHI